MVPRCIFLSILTLFAFSRFGSAQAAPVNPPAQVSQPAVAPDFAKQALVFESLSTKLTYQEDGSDVREQTAVVKVLSQAGVQGLAVLTFSYTSANESVEFDYVRVRKADGAW